MKRAVFMCAGVLLAVCVGAWASAQAGKKVVYVSSGKAAFQAAAVPGASMSALWGDAEKGPHAVFTKFVPGFDAGVHSHTSDLRIVVIEGAYVYRAGGKETRVGPGDYLFVPGGEVHWSGGDAKQGALFYQEGLGPFDLVPAK